MLLLLGRLILDIVHIWQITNRARPCPGFRQQTTALLLEAGVHRPVRMLYSHEVPMPMIWGLWRPAVLLPENATSWSEERLRIGYKT